jgi:hypothetical protein
MRLAAAIGRSISPSSSFPRTPNVPIRTRLRARILELRGRDSLEVHLAYCILAQLDWSIHHHPRAAVDDGVTLAYAIIEDLEAGQ